MTMGLGMTESRQCPNYRGAEVTESPSVHSVLGWMKCPSPVSPECSWEPGITESLKSPGYLGDWNSV